MTEFVMTKFGGMQAVVRAADGSVVPLDLVVSGGAVSRPHQTSEYLFARDDSFDDFQIWSIDFEQATVTPELAFNFDPWMHDINDMVCDGTFLFFCHSTYAYQLGWDGNRFVRLSRVSAWGGNGAATIGKKPLNEGHYIHVTRTGPYQSGIASHLHPTRSPWVWGWFANYEQSGQSLSNQEWEQFADFKWHLPAHTSGLGDLFVAMPYNSASDILVLSIEGITVVDWDHMDIEIIGTYGIEFRGYQAWDRDTGQIAYLSAYYSNVDYVYLYEVDLDLPQGAPISHVVTASLGLGSGVVPALIGMCNGYTCIFTDETGASNGYWLRTYKYSGGWTMYDELEIGSFHAIPASAASFDAYCYTSPYTGKLYVSYSTISCYDIDDAGNITHLFETPYNGYGQMTTYPKLPDVWFDGSTCLDGLVGLWEFDEGTDADGVPRHPAWTYFTQFQGASTTIIDDCEDVEEMLFEWFRWSHVKTTGTVTPFLNPWPGYVRVDGGSGAWPGAICYANFGNESDGYIETYVYANDGVDGDSAGIVIRFTDIDNFIYAYIKPSDQTFTLAKVENGTETVLDQVTISLMTTTTGGLGKMYVDFRGANITAYLTSYQLADEEFVLEGTTTFQQNAVLHGLHLAGYNGSRTSAGYFKFSPWTGVWQDNNGVTATTYGTTWNSFDNGIALDEDTNAHLSMDATGTGFDSTGAFTMMLFYDHYYRVTYLSVGDRLTLAIKGEGGAFDWWWWLEKTSLGSSNLGIKIGFSVNCGGTVYTASSDFYWSLGSTDTFFACYYDPTRGEIGCNVECLGSRSDRSPEGEAYPYDQLNNGWVTERVSGARSNNYSTVRLGARQSGSSDPTNSGGFMDKLQLYNRVLTFDELLWVGNLLQVGPYNRGSRLCVDYPKIPAPFPSIKVIGDADSQGATVTSLDIPKPFGIEVGDLLVVFAGSDATETTDTLSTTETGFTKIGEFGGEGSRVAAWWKVADGSETDFTIASSTTDELIGYYVVLDGVGSSPILDFAGTTGDSNQPQIYDSAWTNDINVSDLFMALSFIVTDGSDVVSGETAGPTNWTKLLSVAPEGGGSDCGGYLSMQNYQNGTEPSSDTFTSSVTDGYATLVVAIKGVGW